ncbi:MAG: arginase [Bacilli bacterium]|nr:arginase [Bacilli bacterium]
MKKNISLIGVPMDLGQIHRGVECGPGVLRNLGVIARLQSVNCHIIDCGDIPIKRPFRVENKGTLKNLETVIEVSETLAKTVDAVVMQDRFPLILGGDHSIAIGSLAGISKHYKNLGVIWFDAHGDLNTNETTLSGNIHGMPLAVNLGFGHERLTGLYNYWPKVKPENIIIIGVRSIDPGEEELIRKKRIKVYTMDEIARIGILKVTEEAIQYLKDSTDGVHLSFDLDVLDPAEAPGVSTPVLGGMRFDESRFAMKILAKSNLITSLEVVEINPFFDDENKTARLAIDLIESLFDH